MPNGSVNITLRPIKLAILVNPSDKNAILEAIQINTFLWGGIYNPIIPIYKRTPKLWDKPIKNKNGYKDIVNGYLDTYDPDFIVTVGNIGEVNYISGSRKIISSKDIFGENIEKTFYPRYGLGIYEVMNQFIEDDLKFLRKHPYRLISLNYNDNFDLFLKSVFGCLYDKVNDRFIKYYGDYYPFEIKDCNIFNFEEYLKPNYQFLRRITEKYIKHVRTRDAWNSGCVFILNAENNLDIIDYWNLRAIGWKVLPLPIQALNNDTLGNHISGFIEDNYFPKQNNPEIYNYTTILKSRSIKYDIFKKAIDALKIKPPENPGRSKYSSQIWYPRMWDNWAREKDFVEYCIIESDTKSIDLPSNDDRILFDNLKPGFANNYWREGPQFANEIELNVYSDEKELFAKVIPEGNENLIYAFNTYGFDNWRFSRNGLVYLSKHNEYKINLKLPKAEDLFLNWLEGKKFKPVISDNGRIVTQMIKYIGGTLELLFLAKESIIKLLIELREGRTKTEKEILQLLHSLYIDDKGNKKRLTTIESLCRLKILQSGFEIKCPICLQTSWYSFKELDYKYSCPKCFNDFNFYVSTQNDIRLSFKSIGPFSFTKKNYGVLSELLTLRFFSDVISYPTTIITGFKLTNEIEIDLGVLLQSSYMGDKKVKVLFAECKTFNDLNDNDIKRLKIISSKFPGCVLVFATLKNKLSDKEIKLLTPLIKKEQKNRKANKPYNPVLILTGVELFSQKKPPYCWNELGEKYNEYYSGKKRLHDFDGLCRATQDIYLDLEPDSEIIKFIIEKGSGKFVP